MGRPTSLGAVLSSGGLRAREGEMRVRLIRIWNQIHVYAGVDENWP